MLFVDIVGSKLTPQNATEFAIAGIEEYGLEPENVMTLHFMENGDGYLAEPLSASSSRRTTERVRSPS
jgi:hypothetical protein